MTYKFTPSAEKAMEFANEITLKSTIEVINELAYKKKEENDDLLHSINLSICINDLENHFKRLKAITERIDKIKNNQELINLLSQMQNILTQLQLFGINFENQTINSNKDITEEIMKKEKKLYIDRRNWSNIED